MRYKFSQYVVFSDGEFKDAIGDRWRLAYATRTASVVPISTELAGALDRFEVSRVTEELDPDAIRELVELKILIPEGEDEQAAVIEHQRSAASATSDLKYTLLPTSYCNMGCAYCGQQHTKGRVPGNHRDAVAARLTAALERPETRSVRINWFGGEPMMGYAIIQDLCRRILPIADRKGVKYESLVVTNGSLLTIDKLRVLHRECRVGHVEITLDGPARVHDTHRPLKSGGRSFEKILDTVVAALTTEDLRELRFGLRTNIDAENAAYVEEYLDTLADRGLAHDQVSVSLHSIHSWGNDVTDTQIKNADLAKQMVSWTRRMAHLGLNFNMLPGEPTGAVCSAVTRSAEVISSSGNVFSCTEYPLVPAAERDKALARVESLPLTQLRPVGEFDDWHDSLQRRETACGDCLFLPVCGGCCPKLWREGEWPCPDYKFNTPQRLNVLAEMNDLKPVG